jgi:hypothetical protein
MLGNNKISSYMAKLWHPLLDSNFFSHVFNDLGSLLYPVGLGMQRILKRTHSFDIHLDVYYS